MKTANEMTVDPQSAGAIDAVVSSKTRWDVWTSYIADRMNPILVKETRQALKSHQFLWTLQLVLLAILVWSLLGVSMLSPKIFFSPCGPQMLLGYLLILLVPSGIIVPIATFRSMSNEVEHGTFDILSISNLTALQIVGGKVAVAALQTMLYISALAPCIAVTYLLRGLAISTLLIVFAASCLLSLVVSSFGVFMASLAKKYGRFLVVTMLMQILICLLATWMVGVILFAMIFENWIPEAMSHWFGLLAGVLLAISYCWLFIRLAAASISFESDHQSTALRWCVWGQHVLFVSIFVTLQFYVLDEFVFRAMFTILGIHWFAFGAFSICESGVLSPRAQRTLPSTIASKLMFTWFSPGPGTGYVFSVVSYFSAFLAVVLVSLFHSRLNLPSIQRYWIDHGVLVGSYIAAYLGITRLTLLVFQRWLFNRLIAGIALLVILLMFSALAPMIYSYLTDPYNQIKYTPFTILNVFWSLTSIEEARNSGVIPLFVLVAAVIFQINLLVVSKDVMLVRIAIPERVRKELAPSEEQDASVDPLAV